MLNLPHLVGEEGEVSLEKNKVIYMLAIHELEEIEIGNLAFYETIEEEKT